jgi:pilus assembly protein CpaE
LALLASPASLDANATIDSAAFGRVLERVRRISHFVVLDLPHAWSPWTRDTLADADEVVVTVTPDLAALRNAKRLVETLRQLRGQDRPLRIVLNHVGEAKKTELSTKKIAEGLGLTPTIIIPHDSAVLGVAANNGQMAGEVQKTGRVIDAFRELARVISNQPAPKQRKSPLDWLKRTKA